MIDRVENEVEMQERHFQVLGEVAESQPIGIVALSTKLPYPKHQIRYSLRKLEEENAIEPTSNGAVTTDVAKVVASEYQERLDSILHQLQGLRLGYAYGD